MSEMNGNKIFLDTNIVIYILLWNKEYINKIFDKEIYVSFISKLEVLAYNFDSIDDELKAIDFFTNTFKIDLNENIENLVILLKKKYKIKLPDCIILATSIFYNIDLLTNDENLLKIYNSVLSDKEILLKFKIAKF